MNTIGLTMIFSSRFATTPRGTGGGLTDTTRVAGSPARIWTDICQTNADELVPALDRLIESLQSARRDLASGRTLEPMFESAQRWRAKLKA